MKVKSILSSKSLKYGSISVAFTAVFIAILVLLNIVAGLLVERFPLKIDLSSNKMYTLSDETLEFLKTYNKKTEIIFCASKDVLQATGVFAEALELFDNYTKHNPNISITYIDLDQNPAFYTLYKNDKLTDDSIIVKSDDNKYKVLAFSSLFETETDEYGQSTGNVTSSNAEVEMTSALSYLSAEKLTTVAFTTNHGETDGAGLEALITKNNYSVGDDLSLLTDTIPEDTDIIAILAPTHDFDDLEIDKISKFLNNDGKLGKNLLVFMDPSQSAMPKLEAFLAEWGVSILPGFIYDTKYSINDEKYVLVNYTDTEIAADLIQDNLITLSPVTRPVESLFTEKNNYKVSVLLNTFEEGATYYKSDPSGDTDTAVDKKGQYNTMVMASKKLTQTENATLSNILVSGSTDFLDQSLLSSETYGNGSYILKVLNNISGNINSINIIPKTVNDTTLTIKSEQVPIYISLFMVVIPLIVIVFGVVVWLKRRHL